MWEGKGSNKIGLCTILGEGLLGTLSASPAAAAACCSSQQPSVVIDKSEQGVVLSPSTLQVIDGGEWGLPGCDKHNPPINDSNR